MREKSATDELKISLSEKKDKMKILQKDLQKIRKNVEKATKKNSDLHVETIKIEISNRKNQRSITRFRSKIHRKDSAGTYGYIS